MRTRLAVVALVAVAGGCGGGEERRAAQAPVATVTAAAEGRGVVVGEDERLAVVTPWDGSGSLLAPVDRRSLKAGVPWAELGEYHHAWSVSPGGRMAAFGISAPGETARIGLRVIDLGTLQGVKDVEVGIVAEGSAGWRRTGWWPSGSRARSWWSTR